ncbi:SMP-30/gluconolactonase/LRE family protein [uncultured Sphingomonas sp.]|uniref:SMP-30/gluconolactonase/LRE family protein n=1 Tax=uncultured Sphingomonas sp. TaxID=158754 RepID=UPI0025D9F93A|nr:SMP-30/gluconolactonase/LRE family protein [uncultured Sphingomonas sp.]
MRPTINRRALIASGAALIALPSLAKAAPAETRPTLRRLSSGLDRIVAPNVAIETIATGMQWAEGPVWVRDGGYLLFSDPPANIIRRWSRNDGASLFLQPSGTAGLDPALVREAGSNGLALDRQGRLLIANSGGRSIDRLDLRTRTRTVLVDRYQGKRFNSCNDMTLSRTGAIYFTDPPYGFAKGDESPLKEVAQNGVYRWTEGGAAVLVTGALTRPNGLALSPDERRLFVSNSDEKDRRIVAIDLDAAGLPSGAPRTFLDASALSGPGNPDGMKIAADGTMFCSSPGGLWILTPEGERLGLIEHGAPIANCCFGEDGRTLFMTANDRVLRMPLKIDGWRA